MPASPQLHVAHLSTADGLAGLPAGATAEVCPHHLLLNLDACDSLECKVDPPLQTPRDNAALWSGFRDGRIAVLASDHAPHLPEEKASDAPPSGIPGVETMLPLMLQQVVTGNLELGRLVNAMAEAPADRIGLSRGRIAPGQPADLIEVDSKATRPIVLEQLHSRAGWTPYEGWDAIFPHRVWRRGELVAADGEPQVLRGGQPLFTAQL
jgi:dihydroorotase